MKLAFLVFVLALSFVCFGQGPAWKPLEKDARIGHGSMIFSAVFSPDSKYLASYDQPGTIVMWDLATRQMRFRIQETDTESYKEPVFSPNGKILAAVVDRHDEPAVLFDSVIRFWDTATGKVIGTLEGSYRMIDEMVFSPDSNTFYAANGQNTTTIWDTATLKLKPASLKAIGPYAFDATGTRLAATSVDRTSVLILDVKTGKTLRTIPGFGFVVSVGFDPLGKFLAINDEENAVEGGSEGGIRAKMWNLTTGRPVPGFDTVDQHPPVVFTARGKSVLLLQFERNFAEEPVETSRIGAFYDPATGKKQKDLVVNFPLNAFGTTFSLDGRLLAARSASSVTNTVPESEIRVIDTSAGTLVASLPGYRRDVTSMAFTSDGRSLMSAHPDGRIISWNTSDWTAGTSIRIDADRAGTDQNLKLLPGLKLFTMGTVIHTYDVATGAPVHDSTDEKFFKTYGAVSGDGGLMFVADDERFEFYHLPAHNLRNSFPTPLKPNKWAIVSFSMDKRGERLAYDDDSAIIILDTKTGKQISRFPVTKGIIGGIAFSPDGKYIGLANSESAGVTHRWTINVLEASTGKGLISLPSNDPTFAFSADGGTLASLTDRYRILVTRLPDGRKVSESKAQAHKLSGPVYIMYHPTRKILAVGTEYGIQVFDAETGEQAAHIR